jgi:hypothetical protein
MTTVERELIEKISNLDVEQQRRVLDFVRSLEGPELEKTYTARELMKLPPQERNRLVIQALERSANEEVELFEIYSNC